MRYLVHSQTLHVVYGKHLLQKWAKVTPVFFGSPTSRAGGRIVTILRLVDVFCSKDVPFGG